ncbi:type IVB secretion system protein IcmH/DotU [Nitrosomonas communis]|uniref:Type VI secretion system protein ImpK n=1 Tax=Nitrosomonas communis TaxID=44574 RepID=A0A1H2Z9Q5_9PROT|nr:type IVB secretion system protein IcmH/DotU [Nitrosomonas communis]SDX13584.1 type VI secretion system protein ImpK [Nitrosomonas communis]
MNQDDPFASSDLDKTITLPSPGGRTPPSAQSDNLRQSQATSPVDHLAHREDTTEITGINPLVAAANPILNSVPQLRMTLHHSDLSSLRDYLVQRIKSFESQAKASGISPEKVIVARYVLCTLLDETIASTPWGSGEWGKHSLLVMFHKETFGGEKFFQLLKKLSVDPKANRDILELMYISLSLGFEGRYRVVENGKTKLDALRERLAQILNKERNLYERDLSPHWRPTALKRTKIFRLVPLWVLSALCGSILLIIYFGYNFFLNNVSDPIFAKIQSIQAKNFVIERTTISPPPTTPLFTELFVNEKNPLLADLLVDEILNGLVTVRSENDRSIITILGDGLFPAGSATVTQSFAETLSRIAEVLRPLEGDIQIIGHTDNQPIRSIRFPSNWHLSQERAHSVKKLFIKNGLVASRLNAEGRADTEPIASNNTPEGRARNRRVEIVVFDPRTAP